jgi:hypothetical protein
MKLSSTGWILYLNRLSRFLSCKFRKSAQAFLSAQKQGALFSMNVNSIGCQQNEHVNEDTWEAEWVV